MKMDVDELKKNLYDVIERYNNKTEFCGEIRRDDMARDCLQVVEELEAENKRMKAENAKLKTFNRGDFEEFADILEKHDFFCNRAGYELWFEKPEHIQNLDIENQKRDYERMKFLLHRFHEELTSMYENAESWKKEAAKLKCLALHLFWKYAERLMWKCDGMSKLSATPYTKDYYLRKCIRWEDVRNKFYKAYRKAKTELKNK